MNKLRENFLFIALLFIISAILVFDLFSFSQRSATFDGVVHITQIAQFTTAMNDGDFPVLWLDGFANYGLPLGIFAQQLPTYTGAIFNSIVHDPVLAFNLVFFTGVLLSNIFYYYFLRLYFKPFYAFLGTFLFNFAPYRIIDIYIRGVTPEIFSMIFLPLILISIYFLVQKRKSSAFFFLVFSLACLFLAHPIMFVTYAFVYIPYFIFNLIEVSLRKKNSLFHFDNIKLTIFFLAAFFFAFGMIASYLLPLTMEIKYLYYGAQSHFSLESFIGLSNYFDPRWHYFYHNDIFTRGHIIKPGILELSTVVVGPLFIVCRIVKKNFIKTLSIFDLAVIMSIVIIFFTSQYATIIYQHFDLLANTQHQWRMMSGFIFLPPIIIISLLQKLNKNYLAILLILVVCIVRFPQIYGKNYATYPEQSYYFTRVNLHSINMNTIWSGKSEDYPVKRDKIEIIGGKGTIESKQIKNSSRKYVINAKTPVNVVDYTFYFPGWTASIDGQKTDIQFQDPNYRGVITYTVPQGTHTVVLTFEDTKSRFIGKVVSIMFIILFLGLFMVRKNMVKLLKFNSEKIQE